MIARSGADLSTRGRSTLSSRCWRMRTGSTRPRSTCCGQSADEPARAAGHCHCQELICRAVGRPCACELGFDSAAFARRQVVAMVDRIVGSRSYPRKCWSRSSAKTDGVQLFVEEDDGARSQDCCARNRFICSRPRTISARDPLDLAGFRWRGSSRAVGDAPARSAAIGREFSYRLLEAVSPAPGRHCRGRSTGLSRLNRRGAPRGIRPMSSSMHWCRERPMPRCFATGVSASTPKSHVRWGSGSRIRIESAPDRRPSLTMWRQV